MKAKKAFTLIELLVVIAIIALLLAIIMPSLSRAKMYAHRVMCANNLRQQALGTLLYANDHDSEVPRSQSGSGFYLWTVTFWSTNQMSQYAGFDDNKTFFCPANKMKKADDARWWQYGWLASTGGPYTNPVPLRDEGSLTTDEQKNLHRVLPEIYTFDKYDAAGNSVLPDRLANGAKAQWISKLSKLPSASSASMIMDVNISSSKWKFFDIPGGITTLSGGTLSDNSNHKSREIIREGANSGIKPDGGNTAYADGHVNWKHFDSLEHCYTSGAGMWFWW